MFSIALSQAGVAAAFIGMSIGFATAVKQGEFSEASTELEKLLGRKPAAVKAFLAEAYSAT